MQNNDYRPASASQINYLKSLGYVGKTEGLTSGEASKLISDLKGSSNTAPSQPQYQQPTYEAPKPQPYENPKYYQPQGNSIAPRPSEDFSITTRSGESFLLDKATVETYICSAGTKLTDQEYRYFFSVCKNLGLNPFLRDIYAIKFGTSPAQFVIDYKVLQQAADENPLYNGMKTGVLIADSNGVVSEHEGAYLLPGETLLGAWCEVYRKDRTFPTKTYAMFNEVCKFKDGNPSGTWKEKPVFMNVKVAKAWALRETFPNLFSNNTYTSDEVLPRDEAQVINQETPRPSKQSVSNAQSYGTASVEPPIDAEETPNFNL